MNYIDLVLGILLVVAAIRGFSNGFVAEVASLAALILGVWGAIHFSHFVSGFIIDTFDYHPKYLNLIAFFVTFIVIVILVYLGGKLVDKIVTMVALGFLNRLAGILFGIIKTALILSILLLILEKFDEKEKLLPKRIKERSHMYEPVKSLLPTLLPFLNFWDIDEEFFRKEKEESTDDIKKVA